MTKPMIFKMWPHAEIITNGKIIKLHVMGMNWGYHSNLLNTFIQVVL